MCSLFIAGNHQSVRYKYKHQIIIIIIIIIEIVLEAHKHIHTSKIEKEIFFFKHTQNKHTNKVD